MKALYRSLLALLVSLLWLTGTSPSQAESIPVEPEPLPPFAVIELPANADAAPADLRNPAGVRLDEQAKSVRMDSILTSLAAAQQRHSEQPPQSPAPLLPLQKTDATVQIQIHLDPAHRSVVSAAVAAQQGVVTGVSLDETRLQAWMPIQALAELAEHPAVHYLRHAAPVVLLNDEHGDGAGEGEGDSVVSSEALAVFDVAAWHKRGRQGEGVTIAIIDGGFQGYQDLLGSELPEAVTAINFVDGEEIDGIAGSTSHGTAVAEIVHDVAPHAQLYLVRIGTDIDLEEAVSWLARQKIDIISTSVGWYNLAPGDGTGRLSRLAELTEEKGILWVTAAGNDRENHWGGPFADADGDQILDFAPGQEVNYFGPARNQAYLIPPGVPLTVHMRWNDWDRVRNDFDLYLMRWNGDAWQEVAQSRDVQKGDPGQTPTETLFYVTEGARAPYGFLVTRHGGFAADPINFDIFVPKYSQPHITTHERSLTNLADIPLLLTVAAVDTSGAYQPEIYSSEGPTNGPGGSAEGGLSKPDLAAYTNVTTASWNGKFAGTSAATPHVAGAAALIADAFPEWSPAQIRAYLQQQAIRPDDTEHDTRIGYGRLYLGPPPSLLAGSSLEMTVTPTLDGDPSILVAIHLVNHSSITTTVSLENRIPDGVAVVGQPNALADPQPRLENRQLTWAGQIAPNTTVILSYQGIGTVVPGQSLRLINLATVTASTPESSGFHLSALFNPLEIFLPLLTEIEAHRLD